MGALIIFGIVVPILAPIAWQLKGIIAFICTLNVK